MSTVNQKARLSHLGNLLVRSLGNIDDFEKEIAKRRKKETFHVPTVGSKVSTAYEQLRNASEYAEDDLLEQRAIRRYLKRVLSFHTKSETKNLASELVTELTQSEYLKNDYTPVSDIDDIAHHIDRYYGTYWKYTEHEHRPAKRAKFQDWILDILSVRCEQTLSSHIRQLLFAHFAFSYIHDKIDIKKLIRDHEKISKDDYPIVLYIAIHRSLLKSDNSTIRAALLDSYRKDVHNIEDFEAFNKTIDELFETKTVAHVARVVGRNGAVLRFIYTGFFRAEAPMTASSLKSEDALEHGMRQHISHEYSEINKKLDRGILKSVAFLFVTKTIVGVTVEVPYDYWIYGQIIWLPLILNLFFPSIFIAISRLALSTPDARNTDALVDQTNSMLFFGGHAPEIKMPKESRSTGFNAAYAVMFMIMFAGLTYVLYLLHFNFVQGAIFFIFLSTASFLSFRLSRIIQEAEAVHANQSTLSLLRDVLYMPFIYVGQQISYRYSKVNIVALVLDILIELPLKSILRLVRQWTQFLSSKKDEMI